MCIRNGIKKEGESCTLNNNCSYPYCQEGYIEPDWVCINCAMNRGARIPEGHCYTVHTGICGICNTTQTVTEPRDFGRTRNLLKIKI